MINLTGKVAVITGAGSGIGKETAIRFAQQGASVVCADIRNAEAVAQEITNQGLKAIGVQLDVAEWASWENLIEQTEKQFGEVDILCGVAGISEATNILELTEAQFDVMMNINVKGVFFGMKAVLPAMLKKQAGKIVNVASLAAHCGLAGLPSYSASKGAVIAMSRQVAMDYAKHNIQVNVLSPGIIATPILENNSPEMTKAFTAATPAGRLGKPVEMADTLLFLCAEESGFLTGQTIIVDGGWSAQ